MQRQANAVAEEVAYSGGKLLTMGPTSTALGVLIEPVFLTGLLTERASDVSVVNRPMRVRSFQTISR
jgi:hypothetical protein